MSDHALEQLRLLVEHIVRPLRAGASRKDALREELLAHVLGVYEEEMARLRDERAALERTARRFGNPSELTGLLQDSMSASSSVGRLADQVGFFIQGQGMINHNRLYNILLVTLGINISGGLCLLGFLLGMAPDERPRMLLPQWSLPVIVVGNGLYLLAIVVTLLFRFAQPALGKRLTKAMNLLFLIAPPFGTALGIYGLWKVDRADRGLELPRASS